jgi:hypothetical protein
VDERTLEEFKRRATAEALAKRAANQHRSSFKVRGDQQHVNTSRFGR